MMTGDSTCIDTAVNKDGLVRIRIEDVSRDLVVDKVFETTGAARRFVKLLSFQIDRAERSS